MSAARGVLLALCLTVGCAASPKVHLTLAGEPAPPAKYTDELKRWSRHGHIIADFDEALSVDATLHSPDFQAAFIEKWNRVYRVSPEEAARIRAQLFAQVADVWELHLEVASHRYEVNDFTSQKSIWRVALIDDRGRQITTTDVHLVRERREVDFEFYPQASIFSKGWTFRFPRQLVDGTPLVTPETRALTLRISGPPGSTDLVWQLE